MSDRFSLIPAAYVVLRRGTKVLLQLRQNTGYMDGHWATGAAGHVEAGESVTQAGCREAMEELGVLIAPEALRPVAVMHRRQDNEGPVGQRVDWFFECTTWEGEPSILEPNKCAALEWFELAALPTPMPDHELSALAVLRDAEPFTHLELGFEPGDDSLAGLGSDRH